MWFPVYHKKPSLQYLLEPTKVAISETPPTLGPTFRPTGNIDNRKMVEKTLGLPNRGPSPGADI